jgi:hypothetical protein
VLEIVDEFFFAPSGHRPEDASTVEMAGAR